MWRRKSEYSVFLQKLKRKVNVSGLTAPGKPNVWDRQKRPQEAVTIIIMPSGEKVISRQYSLTMKSVFGEFFFFLKKDARWLRKSYKTRTWWAGDKQRYQKTLFARIFQSFCFFVWDGR